MSWSLELERDVLVSLKRFGVPMFICFLIYINRIFRYHPAILLWMFHGGILVITLATKKKFAWVALVMSIEIALPTVYTIVYLWSYYNHDSYNSWQRLEYYLGDVGVTVMAQLILVIGMVVWIRLAERYSATVDA